MMARPRTSVIWTTPIEEFTSIINNSITIKEVILKLGLNYVSSHYKTINARIKEEGIDISHFNPTANRKPSIEKTPLNNILVENSTYSRHLLKPRLIEEGLLEEICESCGIGSEWNGEPLSLQLDHINGVNDDNRFDNLRFLCPNCHSQTETFGARNHKKKDKPKCRDCGGKVSERSKSGLCIKCNGKANRKADRPSKDILLSQVKELGYVGTGKMYGVSDNAVRKWLKSS